MVREGKETEEEEKGKGEKEKGRRVDKRKEKLQADKQAFIHLACSKQRQCE